jgi:hypothetical protein
MALKGAMRHRSFRHRRRGLRARLKAVATTAFFAFLAFSIPAFALDDGRSVLYNISGGIALASLFTAGVAILAFLTTSFIGRREL